MHSIGSLPCVLSEVDALLPLAAMVGAHEQTKMVYELSYQLDLG